jgi:hypothetical protein
MERVALEEDIRKQEIYMEELEIKLTETQHEEETQRKAEEDLAQKNQEMQHKLAEVDEELTETKTLVKVANIITRREEKRACGKELERLTNIFKCHKANTPERVETPKTIQDAPRGKKKIKNQRFVMSMRGASFKPGEESGGNQFGTSGKGRFFTTSFFFGRLEIQESRWQNQVIEQVDADWATRAKLTGESDEQS